MSRYPKFHFDILNTSPDSRARRGRVKTPHGPLETPNFIFCGTKAAIKGVPPAGLKEAGVGIILANTYHLMLSPGADLIERLGGLHEFTRWDGPMLTDSGGYQVFAMQHGSMSDEIKGRSRPERNKALKNIDEEGAWFKSHIDGSMHFLSPETSIDIQRKLGADFVVQMDECTAHRNSYDYTRQSLEMSARWGDRSLAEFDRGDDGSQAVYGVVQGGVFEDLRKQSAELVSAQDFFAIGIGGCFGRDKHEMYDVFAYAMENLRRDCPVHGLGVGDIPDIFAGVRLGMDTFDCVAPTRIARHGWAIVKGGKRRMNLRNAQYKEDPQPVDETCPCSTCRQGFSRAYLHHLIRCGELIGMTLLVQHNITTMMRLMEEIRESLQTGQAGALDAVQNEWLPDGLLPAEAA